MLMKQISAKQTGVLLFGPGGCRLDAVQSSLSSLTTEQFELVSRAKKYATEQSIKHITTRPVVAPPDPKQKSVQRYQALMLMCRVYVGNISFEVREEMVQTAFSPYGSVKSVNMTWDPITLKHKGFAFVEYELPEAAQLALEHMNAIQLGGRQIKVGRPSNTSQAEPVVRQIQEECKQIHRIYVSNVHPNVAEQDLAELFEPFGEVLLCKLAMTPGAEPPQHRGCGFIEFRTESAAIEALAMNGHLNLGGTVLHVCGAMTPAENVTIYGTLEPGLAKTSRPIEEPNVPEKPEPADKEQRPRHSAECKTTEHPSPSPTGPDASVIVLKNMIASDEEIDDSLHLDVHLECSKHGKVKQVVIYVDKNVRQPAPDAAGSEPGGQQPAAVYQDEVKIFVKYHEPASGARALAALNGRFFAGRKVSAAPYEPSLFRRHIYTQ